MNSVDAAMAAYRADYTSRGWSMNRLFAGIPALLADLKAAGVRLAVATSKAEPTARRILAHFELDTYFEVIAGASVDAVPRVQGRCARPTPSLNWLRCRSGS